MNLERTRDHGQHVVGLRDGVRAAFGRAPWLIVSRGPDAAAEMRELIADAKRHRAAKRAAPKRAAPKRGRAAKATGRRR